MILDFSYPRNLAELRLLARAVLVHLEKPRSPWEGPLPVLLAGLILALATAAIFASGPRTHNELLAGGGILVIDATGATNMDSGEMKPGPYTLMLHEGDEVLERQAEGSPEACLAAAYRLAVYHNAEALCMLAIAPIRSLTFAPEAEENARPQGPFLSIEVPTEEPS